MITLQGTYLTDDIARDGSSFSIGAMYDAVWQGSIGGTPTNITHDIHRTIGWTLINSLYVTPIRTSVIGKTYIMETEEEKTWLSKKKVHYLNDHITKGLSPYKDGFIQALVKHGITNPISDNFFYNGIAVYHSDGIAEKLFTELTNKDSKGLIYISDLRKNFKYIGQGVFKRKWSDICILIHPYLRKSQSYANNYNLSFLEQFFSLLDTKNVNMRIRIDADKIAYAPSFVKSIEYEYWYHPQYDDDIASIPPGLTCMETPEEEKIYNQINRTEFAWSTSDDEPYIRTLEVEEVINEKSPMIVGEIYPCRYVHSQYDQRSSQFVHFDGAIRGYTFEQIIERIENPMTECGHKSDYTKLFRIDGKLSLEKWKSLITQYLNGNSQVLKYFKVPEAEFELTKTNEEKNPLLDYVPCMMTEDDGVCVNISFFPVRPSNTPRYFDSFDVFRDGIDKIQVVESSIIDVQKMLCREGATIEVPKGVLFAEIDDNYYNIPIISHGDVNTQENLNKTFSAIYAYVNKLAHLKKEMIYSFALGFNLDGRYVVVSFLGHVNCLAKWMKSSSNIPINCELLRRWSNDQSSILRRKFKPKEELIKERFIQNDGTLYIKRKTITPDVKIEDIVIENSNINAKINFEDEQQDLVKLFQEGAIKICSCTIFNSMKCLTDNRDYLESSKIAVFGETSVEIHEMRNVSFFWTND